MNEIPKVKILLEGGVIVGIVATAEVEAEIIDRDQSTVGEVARRDFPVLVCNQEEYDDTI